MAFAENLIRIRTRLHYTQEELSKRSGLTDTTISHYETGRRRPSLDNIIKLKKGIGCSFDDLLVDSART